MAIGQRHELADSTMAAIRRTCRNLRPSILDDLGVVPATRALTGELAARSGIQTGVVVLGEQRRLPPDTELLSYRVVQEALNNVERHSEATRTELEFRFRSGLQICITDNGRGLDSEDFARRAAASGKLGLLGMRPLAQRPFVLLRGYARVVPLAAAPNGCDAASRHAVLPGGLADQDLGLLRRLQA